MAKEESKLGHVTLKNVRLSFADIFQRGQAQQNDDGEMVQGKFSANFLIDKKTKAGKANVARVKAAADEVKKAKWGQKIPKLKPEKVCLRDGDLEDYDGYPGQLYVSSRSASRPVLVDRHRQPTHEDDGLLYAGCYVNARVNIWAQDNQHGKRINASLEGVQFVSHGEAFGHKAIDAEEEFDDLGEDEDDGFDEDEDEGKKQKKTKKSRSDDDDDDDDGLI